MKEIFSDPLFLNNSYIWDFLMGDTGNFNQITLVLMKLDEAIVMYFITISFLLIIAKRIDWKIHLIFFVLFGVMGDIFPAQAILQFIGSVFDTPRIYNLNAESFRHIIALFSTIVLVFLAIKQKTRSVSRVVFAASGIIIFLTTMVFHILYFHTLQAVALNSHTNHAKMITLLDDKDYNEYCALSNLQCFSGREKSELSTVSDPWIRNYIQNKLNEIEAKRSYEIRDIRFEIMKTNIVGNGARTGFFKKNDSGWRVVINQDSVKSFARALELTFWVQMVMAHFIWISLSVLVILAHEKRVFKKSHIKVNKVS